MRFLQRFLEKEKKRQTIQWDEEFLSYNVIFFELNFTIFFQE